MKKLACLTFAIGLAVAAPCAAQESSKAFDKTFVTKHSGTFNGQTLRYTATVASTTFANDAGAPGLRLVTTDYVRDGVKDVSERPVIFGWAGGPSNPSTAYHMRILGPRQIFKGTLRDNPDSVIDVADIVLVDPAETGFSRILPGGNRAYYYSVGGDAQTMVRFIDGWMKAHGRPNAPRYVMGGSYGSVRDIRVAYEAMKAGQPVAGIIMTGNSAMVHELGTIIGGPAALPTLAVTAVYHGKADRAGRSDEQIVDEAYRFAMHDYLPALATLQEMSPDARGALAEKLAAMTGLPVAEIESKEMVVDGPTFARELLRSEGKVLSDLTDGRFTSPAAAPIPVPDENTPLLKTYLSKELGVTYDMDDYATYAPGAGKEWDFRGPKGQSRNDWSGLLKEVVAAHPKTKIYSANGYYDLLSLVGQERYFFARTKLPEDRRFGRDYAGAHGLYSDPEIATAMLRDLRKMIIAP